MITAELFKKRLRDFFSCWRSSYEELWGSSDIIVVSTPLEAQPSWNLRSRDFFLWLLGEDVAGTTAVFIPSLVFFLCTTPESFYALHSLRGYAMMMNIGVSVEFIKADEGVSKLDRIIIESRRRCLSCCSSSLSVGCIDWEWIMIINSKVLNDFEYRIVGVDPGVRKLIGQEDSGEVIDNSSRIYKDDILFATYLLLRCNAIEAMDELGDHNKSHVLKKMKKIISMSLGDEADGTSNSNKYEEMKLANKLGIEIKQRLILLYSKWRKYRKELWGDSDVLVVTSTSKHPVLCSFFLWLLGRNFPNTTAVFKDHEIDLICPIQTCPELCVLGLYMATALEISVSVEPRLNADDESQVLNSSTLYPYRDRGADHPPPVIIGYIDGEAPNSKFLHKYTCGCVECGRRFQATNGTSDFLKLLYEVIGEDLLLESLQTPPPSPPPPRACMFSSYRQKVESIELRHAAAGDKMKHYVCMDSSTDHTDKVMKEKCCII